MYLFQCIRKRYLLVEILNQCKRAQPASSAVHIERMETMEDFEKEEQRISDAKAFDALVNFTSLKIMDSLAQYFPTLVLKVHRPACFPYFPAPAHLIQMNGPSSAVCRALKT